MKINKQSGFVNIHLIIPVLVALIIGVIGAWVWQSSRAATALPTLTNTTSNPLYTTTATVAYAYGPCGTYVSGQRLDFNKRASNATINLLLESGATGSSPSIKSYHDLAGGLTGYAPGGGYCVSGADAYVRFTGSSTDGPIAENKITIPMKTPSDYAGSLPFADVKPGAAFYKEIAWIYGQGITRGVTLSDGTKMFYPRDHITREAMAAFMYRFSGIPADWTFGSASSYYGGIKPGDAFFNEIQYLYSSGIEDINASFRPTDKLTREEMAVYLYALYYGFRNSDLFTPPQTSPFSDVKPDHPHYRQIMWLYDQKITTGSVRADGSRVFAPNDPITREAMSAFLYRAAR